MSRQTLARMAAAAAVLAVVAGVAISAFAGRGRSSQPQDSAASPAAVVERRDLRETLDVDATLGFGDDRTVVARATGVITSIARAGEVVRPGKTLYSLDGDPVLLLDGARPAFRDLEEGVSNGVDVLELEGNLRRLGFGPPSLLEVDRHFSASTRAAIEALQRALGVTPTGRLTLGTIVFLPGERRVTSVLAHSGDAVVAGARLLDTAATSRVATMTLDMSQRSLAAVGNHVGVELPDSRVVIGTISSIGASASVDEQSVGGGSGAASTVDVSVAIATHLTEPDGTPVVVHVATATRRSVLSVPVTALLATAGGQRALEVLHHDGSTTIVPVRTGLYAGGFVEVSGRGIAKGVRVLDAPTS